MYYYLVDIFEDGFVTQHYFRSTRLQEVLKLIYNIYLCEAQLKQNLI